MGKLKWIVTPLAFLTEAADDICYGIMDLEDGYNHGVKCYLKFTKGNEIELNSGDFI
jgi:dGTP triphosphohydrolase